MKSGGIMEGGRRSNLLFHSKFSVKIFSLLLVLVTPSGLVVVLRSAGSNPAEDNGLLRAIKICSTTSFGGVVKPLVPYGRFMACERNLKV
jgi:hypothetical protein